MGLFIGAGLLAVFFGLVWLGRQEPVAVRSRARALWPKVAGYLLLALAALMTLRGLWEPAILPAMLGLWLARGGTLASFLGSDFDPNRGASAWRQNAQGDAGARRRRNIGGDGVMTEQEAYEILGLQPGQSRDAVRAAYRAAMKKVHPDQGGSAEMAVRLNLARDLLLQRHA